MYKFKSFVHKNWKFFFDPSFFSWILWMLATLPLVIVACIGTFSRYIADDYSTVGMAKTLGFWNSQIYWFQTWTGSFTYNFLTSFLGLLDVYTASWLPLISLLAWFALLFGAFKYSFLLLGLSFSRGWLALITSLAMFTCSFSFADYTQALLWQTGIVAYLFAAMMFSGIILYVCYDALSICAQRQSISVWELLLVFLSCFLFVGIGETWAVMQIALLSLGLIFLLVIKSVSVRKRYVLMFAVGMFASISAFVILFVSPGNASRKNDFFVFSVEWAFQSLWLAALDALAFLSEWTLARTTMVVVFLVVGIITGFFASQISKIELKQQTRYLAYILFAAFVMLWSGLFPGFFVFGGRPPDRAIFPTMSVIVFAATLVSVWAGQRLSQLISPLSENKQFMFRVFLYLCAIFLLLLSPVRTASGLLNLLPTYMKYAQLWDIRDAYLRQASREGQGDVVVFSFKGHPEFRDIRKTIWVRGDMEDNPRYWINEAASVYYGLNSIIAVNEK